MAKKKAIKIKRNLEEGSQLEFRLKQHRKRLGLKKPPREVAPSKLQVYWEERDAKMLQDKREDIKRRKKLALRVKKFGELLKEEFGAKNQGGHASR